LFPRSPFRRLLCCSLDDGQRGRRQRVGQCCQQGKHGQHPGRRQPARNGPWQRGPTASTSTPDDTTTASTGTPQHDTSTGPTAQAMHGRRRSTTLHAMGEAITQLPRALLDATP